VVRAISTHMSSHGLYDNFQSAYRTGRSVETALLRVKNDIDIALDEGDGILLLLTDLSAAFDTVDHSILLERMSSLIGVRGTALQWITSYLESRTQCVSVGGEVSDTVPLTTGVPQGSVLGPLLFLCYILPLGCVIDRHSLPRHGFADDGQTYVRFKLGQLTSLHQAISKLESCVSDIRIWMSRNQLKLNDDKTEFLLIAPKYHMPSLLDSKPTISVGDAVIEPATSVRNLGAVFDRHMDMSAQVDRVTRSVYHSIRQISKIRHILDTDTCKKIVNALVVSRFDFNNALLFGLPETLLARIQRSQNAAARLVSGARKYDHVTPLLRALHWLPVRQRIVFKTLILVYKIIHNLSAPAYLADLISLHVPTRTLRSADRHLLLSTARVHKAVGDRAFQSSAPRLWNSLSDVLQNAPSLESFKASLKTHLFTG
jgi:hypothetical protein